MTLFAKGVAGVGLAALLALLLVSRGAGQTPAWTSLGPPVPNLTAPTNFVDNRRVAAIAVDQSDQRRWLIGYGNSGVWETRDSGNSFRAHSDGWPARRCLARWSYT